MCGLVGALGPGAGDPEALAAMVACVAHRGPDGRGTWVEDDGSVALGHVRLAVVGVGPAGAQPMVSASGRWVLAHNGEVYDHLRLRRRLEAEGRAPAWRGDSDTETLLAAFDAWGPRATLERATGMWALAAWDRERRALTLARDRLGEKPLALGWQGRTLLFASEVDAVLRHPAATRTLDRLAIARYLEVGVVAAPSTVWAGVGKLPPGTSVTLTACDVGRVAPEPYWSLADVALAGRAAPMATDAAGAEDLVAGALADAVERQLLAEVPVGAFLSGGVDSTAVVAAMRERAGGRVRTFTIGFDDASVDESAHARAVAAHLRTEHTEWRVTDADARALVPDLATVHDEPFADASAIPTLLLVRRAREAVTVALTGDGGDELLGGYTRYDDWQRVERLPAPLRAAAGALVPRVPVAAWDALLAAARAGGRRSADGAGVASRRLTGHRLHVLADLLARPDGFARYRALTAIGRDASRCVLGVDAAALADDPRRSTWDALAALPARERLMALDAVTYLPDDVLVKVDRAAMSVALETRVPLLDHHLVGLVWRLRPHLGPGKRVLRRIAERAVPAALLDRPKAGFGVPLAAWLRGPLRPWAEDLLAADAIRAEGLLDPAPVRRWWDEHLAGRRERHNELWAVLMLRAWTAAQR